MNLITGSNKKVYCVGHRGAAGYKPENSLISIQTALDMGVDSIEIDVHLVEDELIVFHDHRLERLTGQFGLLADLSLKEIAELESLGEPIPTLRDVVALINRQAGLNIELKGRGCHSVMARYYKEMLTLGWNPADIVVSSFDHTQLVAIKKLLPDVQIGMLIECLPADLAAMAVSLQAYSIHISKNFVSKEFVEDAHQRGFKVFCYTVNYLDEMAFLVDIGVDGIITDYPDRVGQLRL